MHHSFIKSNRYKNVILKFCLPSLFKVPACLKIFLTLNTQLCFDYLPFKENIIPRFLAFLATKQWIIYLTMSNQDFETQSKPQYNVEKNYAPIDPRILNLSQDDKIIDTNAIYRQRQIKRSEANVRQIPNLMTLTPIHTNLKVAHAKIVHNREGYAKRTAGRFAVQSPLLNVYLTPNLTSQERLRAYNKRHKCSHGRWFNVIEPVYVAEKLVGYKVRCEHMDEHLSDTISTPCGNCASPDTRVVWKEKCACEIKYCCRCKCCIYSYTINPESPPITLCCCACGGNKQGDFTLNIVTKPFKKAKNWKTIASPVEPVVFEAPKPISTKIPFVLPKRANWKRGTKVNLKDFLKPLPEVETQGGRLYKKVFYSENLVFSETDYGLASLSHLVTECLLINGPALSCLQIQNDTQFRTSFYSKVFSKYINDGDYTAQHLLEVVNVVFEGCCSDHEPFLNPPLYDLAKIDRSGNPIYFKASMLPIFNHFFFQSNNVDLSSLTKKERHKFILCCLDRFCNVYSYQSFLSSDRNLRPYFDITLFDKTIVQFLTNEIMDRQGGALSAAVDFSTKIGETISSFVSTTLTKIYDIFNNAYDTVIGSIIDRTVLAAQRKTKALFKQYFEAIKKVETLQPDLFVALCSTIYTQIQSASTSNYITFVLLFKRIVNPYIEAIVGSHFEEGPSPANNSQDGNDFHDTVEEVEPQAGSHFDSFVSFFTNCLKFPRVKFSGIRFTEHAKNFNTIVTSGKNLISIFYAILDFLPKFLRSYLCTFDTTSWMRSELRDTNSPFYRLTHNALACQVALNRGSHYLDYKEQAKLALDELYLQIKEEGIMINSQLSNQIKSYEQMMFGLPELAIRTAEPFTIKITSSPGMGKSTTWPAFVSPLFPSLSVKSILEHTYTRNVDDEFWDACNPEKHQIILYDDFNQDREETDLKELISLVSKSAFMPPFSSITKSDSKISGVKGMSLAPKLVVLLSNTETVNSITLNSSEAVNRRRHIHITMRKRAPEEAKTLTGERKPQSHDPNDFDIYYTTDPNSLPNKLITFKNLQVVIRDTYKRYLMNQRQITTDVNSLMYKESGDNEDLITVQHGYRDEVRFIRSRVDQFLVSVLNSKQSIYAMSMFYKCFDFYTDYKCIFKPLIACCTALTAAFGAFKLIQKFIMPISSQTQSGENSNVKILTHPKISVQGTSGCAIADIVANNTIRVIRGNDFCTGFFVSGRTFITSGHIFKSRTDDSYNHSDPITLIHNNSSTPTTFNFDPSRLSVVGKDKDVVLYRVDSRIGARKTLTHLFYTGTVILENRKLAAIKFDGEFIKRYYGMFHKDKLQVLYNPNLYPNSQSLVHTMFSYNIPGSKGDCGSGIVIDDDLLGSNLIAGIHSGYNHNQGYAVGFLVTRQMVLDALQVLDERLEPEIVRSETQSAYFTEVKDDDKLVAKLPGSTVLEFKLDNPITQNTKSSAIPSPLFNKIVVNTTIPAILSPKDPRLPEGHDLFRGQIKKYTHNAIPFTKEEIDSAMESVYEDLNAIPTITLRRVLTEDEAINGVQGYPFLDSLDMTTSAGFPFNLSPALRGEKRKLFTATAEGKYSISNPILRKQLDERTEFAKKGIMSNDVWIDTLKDERRPIEKVYQGKTRLFAASPCAFIIHSRRFFLSFVSHFYQCKNKCFSAVGIDKSSTDWNDYFLRLREVSDVGFAGDYSNWDGSVLYEVLQAAYGLINRWYNDEHTLERRTIAQEVGQARHAFENWVYSVDHSLPSGIDMTVVINNLVNECGMRIAWTRLVKQPYNSFYYYRKYVRTSLYGDDNIVSVSRLFVEQFNQLSVTNFFKNYNITYTNADKTESSQAYSPLEELTFLKCATGMLEGYYVPIMDESSNLETLNWITRTKDFTADQLCENNCNSVLRNCFFSGRIYFDKIRSSILSVKPSYNLLTYNFLLHDFLSTGKLTDDFNEFGYTKSATARIPRPLH